MIPFRTATKRPVAEQCLRNTMRVVARRIQNVNDEIEVHDVAARIANSDRTDTASRGGQSPSYEKWTKDDLYGRAQELGIDGRSTMTKSELIDALRDH